MIKLGMKKTFSILFKKSSLLNLLIFSVISILSTSTFFMRSSGNHILQIILCCLAFSLLLGYAIKTAHLYILNNCEEIELPTWNINILNYIKYSFSFIFILIIFQLIYSPIYLIHIEWLSIILQLLCLFIFSFVGPCSAIIYAKDLKIKDALNYKIYYYNTSKILRI